MLKTLYDSIRKDAAPAIINLNGRDYTDKQIYPVNTPEAKPLSLTTLTGIVDYITANMDKLKLEETFCHVVSPSYVCLCSSLLPPFLNRSFYVEAKPNRLELPFNKWMEAEPFNIALQACFIEPEGMQATDKGLVLKYVSNVTSVVESAHTDDGISQAVAVKSGITSKQVKELPNPVRLRSYRTFTEIEQPESAFVFRCKQLNGAILFMLCEADGGAWQSEAMKNIQDYLRKHLSDLKVIA